MDKINWVKLKYNDIDDTLYSISDTGLIKNNTTNELLNPYYSTNGNIYVQLNTYSGNKILMVNKLMAYSFNIDSSIILPNKHYKIIHKDKNLHNMNPYNLEWIEDTEKWCDVCKAGFVPNIWQISNFGRIYGHRYKKYLKLYTDDRGYRYIKNIRNDQRYTTECVHRLVGKCFIPNNNPDFNVINHIDGNPSNNHYLNLEWCDDKINNRHAFKFGLIKILYGEQNSSCKISQKDVEHICELLLKYNGDATQVSKITGISFYTIRAIRNGISWCEVSEKYFDNRHFITHKCSKIISPDIAEEICKLLVLYDFDISKVFSIAKDKYDNITREKISCIARKKSWGYIGSKYF